MQILIQTAAQQLAEAAINKERAEQARWSERFTVRQDHLIEENKFFSENQRQWGAKPGLNSGNGQTEGAMLLDLFVQLSQDHGPFAGDPDWWKDDKKFYAFLREHPELDRRPGKHSS